ncbi:MAG: hypothetical protein J0H61_09515 [Alphaproteobacteria bacterium]|nr:hypothetical protein [Alphaproteobacteria bacterium]
MGSALFAMLNRQTDPTGDKAMHLRTAYAAMAVFLFSSETPLFAHDNFRVIGIVTKAEKVSIEVKTRANNLIAVQIDKETEFFRDKQKVNQAEVKVGRTVVVDAYGDDYEDLLALQVRLVPAIPASSSP